MYMHHHDSIALNMLNTTKFKKLNEHHQKNPYSSLCRDCQDSSDVDCIQHVQYNTGGHQSQYTLTQEFLHSVDFFKLDSCF